MGGTTQGNQPEWQMVGIPYRRLRRELRNAIMLKKTTPAPHTDDAGIRVSAVHFLLDLQRAHDRLIGAFDQLPEDALERVELANIIQRMADERRCLSFDEQSCLKFECQSVARENVVDALSRVEDIAQMAGQDLVGWNMELFALATRFEQCVLARALQRRGGRPTTEAERDDDIIKYWNPKHERSWKWIQKHKYPDLTVDAVAAVIKRAQKEGRALYRRKGTNPNVPS